VYLFFYTLTFRIKPLYFSTSWLPGASLFFTAVSIIAVEYSQVILLSTLVDTGWHSDVTVSSMLGNTVRPAKIAVFPSLLTS